MLDLPSPQLFLVDGYALIYRAFFAMISRPLTTSRGENTSAAWGIANFLLRLREEYRPDFVAWVHDAGTSFRKERYPEYKATREKLDDELQEAFDNSVQRIAQMLAAFHIDIVAVEGYEADDVIGSLATRATKRGLQTVIVSGDKDFYQLIAPSVSLLNPGRGGPAAVQEELVTLRNANERLGVPPERVVDYLALVGDSSDNVPGVKGVGDKTARQLLEEFGDLDNVLAHASSLKAKRPREALTNEKDAALLSRELVTIKCDVPLALEFDALRFAGADLERLRELFTELEFHSLLPRIGEPNAVAPPRKADFRVASNVASLREATASARAAQAISVFLVASGPEPMQSELIGIAIGCSDGRAWYLPLITGEPALDLMDTPGADHLPSLSDESMEPLVALFEDETVPKIVHDMKGMVLRLRRHNVRVRGVRDDVKISSFLLDPAKRSNEIEVLAREHLAGEAPSFDAVLGTGKNRIRVMDAPLERLSDYACASADTLLRLHETLSPSIERSGLDKLLRDVEMPLASVLADMEWRGITLDTARLAQLAKEFRAELQQLEQDIYREAGTEFNINSTPQLRHVLFEKLNLPIVKKTKTGPSTDADVLAELANTGFTVPRLLLDYRELSKLVSTYVDSLPRAVNKRTHRVHTSFHQTGAATGRLSSSDPNLQNIPVRTERGGQIRTCFVPGPGLTFVVADYSQVELRLLAHLSRDEAFISAFNRGGDIHRETAAIIFDVAVDEVTSEMRARAKTINFATIYGQGPFALSRQLNISSEEAKQFITTYFERFAGVRSFLDRTIEEARERGYVETLFGRRRYIPELKERNFNIRAFGERTAMNSPLQGSAADLIKIAMIRLHARLAEEFPEAGLLLQVHDELVLEANPAETDAVVRIVRSEMENAAELSVPLVVDIGVGPNWLEAKS
jgi:DNA polymerase-1